MHTAIVWAAAFVIGTVGASLVQAVAPMTFIGWLLNVCMFALVTAYSIYPSVRLRRWSLHQQHALGRLLRAYVAPQRLSRFSRFRRITAAVMACAVAVVAYQSMWRPEGASRYVLSAFGPTSTPSHVDRMMDGALVRNGAGNGMDSEHTRLARPAALDYPASEREAQEPRWKWLMNLVFAPHEPEA